jgi:hypothetical protein
VSKKPDLYDMFDVVRPRPRHYRPGIDMLGEHSRTADAKLRRRLRDARIAAKAGYSRSTVWFMATFGERWLRDLEARQAVREVFDRVAQPAHLSAPERCRKAPHRNPK